MAEQTVGTGSLGSTWQIAVDLVSQDHASNTSVVHVRGILYNNSSTTSFNNNAINQYINGSGGWSQNTGISVPGKSSKTLFDISFTIGHDGAGNASVSFTAGFAATGTSGLGGPTSATAGMALPRISKPPSAPYGYGVRNVTSYDAYTTGISVADGGGGALIDIQAQYNTSPSESGAAIAQAGGFADPHMTGLYRATTYYFRVRVASNTDGWGGWGGWTSFTTAATVSGSPAITGFSNIATDSVTVVASAPADNGGSAISSYTVQLATDAAFTANLKSGTTFSPTGLLPGTHYYARVYANNGVGASAPSATAEFDTLSGGKVRVNGAWVNARVWVKVNGAWVSGKVYKKVAGAWKI